MTRPAAQPPAGRRPAGRPAAAGVPTAAGVPRPAGGEPASLPAVDDPGEAAAREFDQEIRSAVRYEKGLAVKAVIALAIVALVIGIRLVFLG